MFPSGVTHDGRYLEPYGVYVERAAGPGKWDVDGNGYVDYYGGHGALLLGHNHPKVLAAAQAALARGTHFGANHPLEVTLGPARAGDGAVAPRWCASPRSGTEATLMALRLARGFTGRRKLLRFRTHFHGWHDHMTSGWTNHMDGSPTTGVLGGVAEQVVLIDPNDTDGVRAALETDTDIAAVIIEPTGSSFGMVPDPARVPGRAAPPHEPARRAPDLRRGGDGLSRVAGRRAGALRHHPGPHHARQDRRRRAAGRRPGRPRRRAPGRSTSSRRAWPRRSSIPAPSTPTRSRPRPASQRSR